MDQIEHERLMMPPSYPQSLFDQIRCPRINKDYIKERMVLPQKFLGACTLKEGTFVTILWLQSVAVTFSAYLFVYLHLWSKHGDTIWKEKFRADYDPYFERDQDIERVINWLWPKWKEVAFILAVTHVVYFVTGLGVCIGLCNNHAHPIVYIPWLIMTAGLVLACFSAGFAMFIVLIILFTYRRISITWDIMPIIGVWAYGFAWGYGFLIVVAHYQRRRIVQFWRKNKRKENQF